MFRTDHLGAERKTEENSLDFGGTPRAIGRGRTNLPSDAHGVKWLMCLVSYHVNRGRMGRSPSRQGTPSALLREKCSGHAGVRLQRQHEELDCALRTS